jgi:hypothetical protein
MRFAFFSSGWELAVFACAGVAPVHDDSARLTSWWQFEIVTRKKKEKGVKGKRQRKKAKEKGVRLIFHGAVCLEKQPDPFSPPRPLFSALFSAAPDRGSTARPRVVGDLDAVAAAVEWEARATG